MVSLVAARVAYAPRPQGPASIGLRCVAAQVRQGLGCRRERVPALDPAYSKIPLSKVTRCRSREVTAVTSTIPLSLGALTAPMSTYEIPGLVYLMKP